MKFAALFLIAIIMGNTTEAMSSMFYYGLGNRRCHQNRTKQVCAVPAEIIACIKSVEIPLRVELVKTLWNSFSKAVPNNLPDTFQYQQYDFDQQLAKWKLFTREMDMTFDQDLPLETLRYWHQEIKENKFYWLPKRTIAHHLMSHLWLEMNNNTVNIGFVLPNNLYGPTVEDTAGLLTQFMLALQVGVVENLWRNKQITVEGGYVTKAPEYYNNLQIDQLFSVCGIMTCLASKKHTDQ